MGALIGVAEVMSTNGCHPLTEELEWPIRPEYPSELVMSDRNVRFCGLVWLLAGPNDAWKQEVQAVVLPRRQVRVGQVETFLLEGEH